MTAYRYGLCRHTEVSMTARPFNIRRSVERGLPIRDRPNSAHWSHNSVVIYNTPIAIQSALPWLYRLHIGDYRAITLSHSSFGRRYISASKRCHRALERVNKLLLKEGAHTAAIVRHIHMDCREGGAGLGGDPGGLAYITHLSSRLYRAYIQGFRAIALSCVSFAE